MVWWKSPRHGKTVNCFEWSEQTASRLLVSEWMQMIRQFGRRMSVRTIRRRLLAAGYWSRRPARCPRLTLDHRRRSREWERRHRVWDLRQWRDCVFSDESRPPYTTVTVGSGCAVGKGRGWLMSASSLMMEIVAREEEWAGLGEWSHETASVHPDPEESNVAMGDGGDGGV